MNAQVLNTERCFCLTQCGAQSGHVAQQEECCTVKGKYQLLDTPNHINIDTSFRNFPTVHMVPKKSVVTENTLEELSLSTNCS